MSAGNGSPAPAGSWLVGIDVGGTFTDLHAFDAATGRSVRHKTPSTPANPALAILGGLAELCAREGIPPQDLARVSHGTTVATNALIQKRGGRVALIVTRGFRDLLEIGRQTRPRIYDFQADHPAPLVPRELRFEADERVTRGGRVIKALEDAEIARLVETVRAANVDAVAICLLFSFLRPDHEAAIGAALRAAMPGLYVSLSSDVQPEFREYERLSTTVLNAYLQPVMSVYISHLEAGAAQAAPGAALGVNQSSAGLISAERARAFPVRTALSGPAAGVAGVLRLAAASGEQNVITLDIGGTSSDICLIRNLSAGMIYERWIEGYPARLPSLDIHAIGAGGGSIAWLDQDGLLKVGPQSAGARPGPACYGHGGTRPTVSDANLLLGRLSPLGLLNGAMPMDLDAAHAVVGPLAVSTGLSLEATALGIIDIAVANMVRGIRTVSIERGHDPRPYTLLAFGGAGPLHASAVARSLGIRRVLVPAHPGILCAQGLLAADHLEHFVRNLACPLGEGAPEICTEALAGLRASAEAWFAEDGIAPEARREDVSLDMRYMGQNFELSVPLADPDTMLRDPDGLRAAFYAAHDLAYGFHNASAPVEIVGLRLLARGGTGLALDVEAPLSDAPLPEPIATRAVWFDRGGAIATPVYRREELQPGQAVPGPAIIEQFDSTTVLFPGDRGVIDPRLNILLEVAS